MNTFAVYKDILFYKIRGNIIVFVLVFIGCVILFPVIHKVFYDEKLKKNIIISCIIGLMAGILVLISIQLYQLQYDVKNDAYITYEGEFQAKEKYNIYIYENGKRKTLSIGQNEFTDGTHTGKIIYGEKTKIVVDYTIYN